MGSWIERILHEGYKQRINKLRRIIMTIDMGSKENEEQR